MHSCGPLQTDQLEPINSSSVPMQDVAWKTRRERWTIVMSGERGSGWWWWSINAWLKKTTFEFVFSVSLHTYFFFTKHWHVNSPVHGNGNEANRWIPGGLFPMQCLSLHLKGVRSEFITKCLKRPTKGMPTESEQFLNPQLEEACFLRGTSHLKNGHMSILAL